MKHYLSANVLEELFRRLSPGERNALRASVAKAIARYGLTYTDERGRTTPITLTLRPRLMDQKRRGRVWRAICVLDGAFRKIAPLYFRVPSLQKIFPFSRRERAWISLIAQADYRPGVLVSRWDANTTFGLQDWKRGFSFFEVNGVGVGGLWYGPASAQLMLEVAVPRLRALDSQFRPRAGHDMRNLLLGVLVRQRKKIGRRGGVIGMMMEKASGSNYIEFIRMARLFTRMGYPAIVTEPTDFKLKGNGLAARGEKIDIVYRDTTLSELCGLEGQGHDLEAVKAGFVRGQMVSSLEGEFDHKSVFEIFTSPEYAKFFTPRERKLFRRHILWTRLLRETKTTDSNDRTADLIPYILKNQEDMVLKPNRLYGGKGVVFGREIGGRLWREKIQKSLKEPGEWVIQRRGELRTKRFFRPDGRGTVERELYVVSGFFATDRGLGVVGRMSERTVVNVARRGGLTPILLI